MFVSECTYLFITPKFIWQWQACTYAKITRRKWMRMKTGSAAQGYRKKNAPSTAASVNLAKFASPAYLRVQM